LFGKTLTLLKKKIFGASKEMKDKNKVLAEQTEATEKETEAVGSLASQTGGMSQATEELKEELDKIGSRDVFGKLGNGAGAFAASIALIKGNSFDLGNVFSKSFEKIGVSLKDNKFSENLAHSFGSALSGILKMFPPFVNSVSDLFKILGTDINKNLNASFKVISENFRKHLADMQIDAIDARRALEVISSSSVPASDFVERALNAEERKRVYSKYGLDRVKELAKVRDELKSKGVILNTEEFKHNPNNSINFENIKKEISENVKKAGDSIGALLAVSIRLLSKPDSQ
jgi:hypothetical protein